MKQFILCLIGLVLTQQGCALVPSQLHLSKKATGYHKQKELKEHKLAKQQHKIVKSHPSLKERITLVDFKLFDKDKHKSQKHQKNKLNTAATGRVATAFYPVGADLVEIPRQGITFKAFLVEHELDLAILTTQADIREKATGAKGSDADDVAQKIAKANEKITSILDLRPDAIILQQGSISTVIPRAMLSYPQVANIPVVPDDAISTLDIVNQELNQEGQFFSNQTVPDKKTGNVTRKQYTLTGLTKKSGSFFTEKSDDINIRTKEYSQEFNANAPAVTVVYRNYRGRLYRIIIPNRDYGALRKPEDAEDDASEDEEDAIEAAQNKWDQNYKNFNSLIIQDGDIIEFTTLDLLDLTSR